MKQSRKRSFRSLTSMALALVFVLGLIFAEPMRASAEEYEYDVEYVKKVWNRRNKIVESKNGTADCVLVESKNGDVELVDDWYVVDGTVTINGKISIDKEVNLILCDDATLYANQGIEVNGPDKGREGSSLNIYAQKKGTGSIVATGAKYHPGIGGGPATDGGIINIHGGNITATGGRTAAGIGGGDGSNGGTVTIYAGDITAKGSLDGAGIGGGQYGNGGTIKIYGGTVNASSPNPEDDNDSYGAAGIGGGYYGNGGDIEIRGGNITAQGNRNGTGMAFRLIPASGE